MKKINRKTINDIILIIFLCIIIGGICLFIYAPHNSEGLMNVEILIDGELYQTYPLDGSSFEKKEITLDTGNTIIIENGYVYMSHSECPDLLCVKQGKISKNGQSIICLPNKVIVRITSVYEDENRLDVMP